MAESSSITSLENDSNTHVTDTTEHSALGGKNIKGSDEVFEMYCEECNRDGIHVAAFAFCMSCVAFFCSTCLRYHGKFLPGHKTLKGEDIPQDICTEKCQIHNNEIVKFYCGTCRNFVCSICKTDDHTDTCSIRYVPDIVNDLTNGEDFKQLMTRKNDIAKHLTDTKTVIDTKYERISSTTTEAKCAIKKEKDTLFTKFDHEVSQMEEKIQLSKTYDYMRVDTAKEQFDSLAVEIEKLSDNIKELSNSPKSQKYKLFIKLIQYSDTHSKVKDAIEGITKECSSSSDTFESELRMQANDLTERVKAFGTLIREETSGEENQMKTAQYMTDINVRAKGDVEDCSISDCCMLSEQYLIVCDKSNSSLKLVDTKLSKLVYVRPVKSKPETTTKINETEFAMVRPYDKDEDRSIIELITLTKAKTLTFQKRRILTEMRCWTIIYINDDRLIISMSLDDEGKIQILDMNGKVLTNIEVDNEGNKIFKCPFCMTLDADAKYAYVCDWYEDGIFEIDLDNQTMSKMNLRFWHPVGTTSDKEGFIYVIELGTNRVHCFHPKSGDIRSHVLLNSYSEKFYLYGICYSVTDNKLYIGYNGLDIVQVYSINDGIDTKKQGRRKWGRRGRDRGPNNLPKNDFL